MKTLYVTDLDGTLLNSASALSEFTLKIINGLVDKGMLFTYATARSLVSASVVTAGLSAKIPIIAYNGAFIFEPESGRILSSEWIEKEHIEYIKDVMQNNGISPIVYSFIDGIEKVSWVEGKETDGMKHYLSKRKGDRRLRPLKTEDGLYDGEIFYFTCIGEKKDLSGAYEAFADNTKHTCTFQQEINRPEYWLEIMPKNATKANAIEKLKKLWDCEKIVSFGDAINDIPMFRISDECYAVENAVEEIKNIATDVIDSNDEDGVAKWLRTNVKTPISDYT